MSEERFTETGSTKVLTEEEKRQFDGVTIDEGGSTYEGDQPTSTHTDPYTNDGSFKVYSLTPDTLLKKVLLGVIIAGIVLLIFFFGGVFLVGFLAVTFIGAVFSILRKLF